jgi:ABC-type dipeptide/oligopeptide/nickel transport system permease component
MSSAKGFGQAGYRQRLFKSGSGQVSSETLYYVWNLAQGDLGVSFRPAPVAQDLAQFLPATVELGLASLLCWVWDCLGIGGAQVGQVDDHVLGSSLF